MADRKESTSGRLMRARAALKDAPDEAVEICSAVLKQYPANTRAAELLKSLPRDARAQVVAAAYAHDKAGRFSNAAVLTETLSRFWPDDIAVGVAASRIRVRLGRISAAMAGLASLLEANPDDLRLLRAQALALYFDGEIDRALPAVEAIIARVPDDAESWDLLGGIHETLGDALSAQACHRKAVELMPRLATAWHNLGKYIDYAKEPDLARILMDVAGDGDLDETDRELMLFALAKAAEDLDERDLAIRCLSEANALHRKLHSYDLDVDVRRRDLVRARFETMPHRVVADDGPSPVLVVGMPRSGTTLMESLLSGHSDVDAAGELTALDRLVSSYLPANVVLDQAAAAAISESYRAVLSEHRRGGRMVVDKMPVNFAVAGFALAAMPDAKVIHMRRDPVATCFSNWKLRFAFGNGFSFEMGDTAGMYCLSREHMAYWAERFPDRVLTVDYEVLVEQPEAESRRIVEFLGLDWQPEMLEITRREGAVRTASAMQVRQGIYRGSSQAWRKYEAHLGQLLDVLAPEIEAHWASVDAQLRARAA